MDKLAARSVAVAWRKAGRRLGLSGPGLLAGLQLDGCIGSFVVRVEQPEDRTRIVVRDERPSALSSLRWRAGAAGTTTDAVTTGDAPFDDRVVASGDPVVVAAFFDASMRRGILRATTGGGRFEDGILTLDLPSPPRSATDLVSAVRRAIGFARRMSTRATSPRVWRRTLRVTRWRPSASTASSGFTSRSRDARFASSAPR